MESSDYGLVTGGGVGVANKLDPGHDRLLGLVIDKYRIVEVIAEGGMGVVCRAVHRDEAIDRSVALKLSQASFLSRDQDARFEIEKAILSELNHPSISHFYDAGVSTEGWPYFVMELIDGQHADAWARGKPLERVVEKFIDVCEAVAFAHARLVIHRDIKPSNVLIDGNDQVKLVDFGVAKILTAGQDANSTAQALSPNFASPEQLRADSLTTATDIYQLGGLLRHLLAELPEINLKDAIDRAVRGDDFRLEAEERAVLGRELSAIVEQCLRNDPVHRYASVEALISDLRAWEAGYPVNAVSQSTSYRVSRFVRRHAIGVSVFASVLALLLSLGTYAVYEGYRAERALEDAERARDTSQQVTQFLVQIFERANPTRENPDDISVRAVLDQGYAVAREELVEDPRVRAAVLAAMGSAYHGLGVSDKDLEIQKDIIETLEDSGAQNDPALGRALLNYANAFAISADANSIPEVETLKRRAVDYLQALTPLDHRLLGSAMIAYGVHQQYEYFPRRTAEAREWYGRAIKEFQKMEEPDYSKISSAHNNIAVAWLDEAQATGADISMAVREFKQSMDVLERSGIDNPRRVSQTALNLGASYLLLNDPVQALRAIEPARDVLVPMLPGHALAVYAVRLMGNIAVLDGRYADAEAHFTEALQMAESVQGNQRDQLLGVLSGYLAELRYLQGREVDAAKLYDEAFKYFGSPVEPEKAMEWLNTRIEWYPLERLTPSG